LELLTPEEILHNKRGTFYGASFPLLIYGLKLSLLKCRAAKTPVKIKEMWFATQFILK
jgi:hypothetical protein